MNITPLVTSAIRTGVPMLVGFLLSWLTSQGFDTSTEQAAGLVSFLTALFGWVYYLIARVLETKNPKLGWLLGSAKTLTYTEPKK